MIKRPLGSTGLLLSPLGLGTVKLGRAEQVKYPTPFTLPTDAQAAELLAVAGDLGINVLDTAPAYGTSEERLGTLLDGQRDRWVLITKAGEEFEGGRSHFDFSPAAVRASVDRSLRRLRTDRVELLLLHSDGGVESNIPPELWAELRALKQQGKIRAFGISTKTVEGSIACLPHVDALMVTINPRDPAEREVVMSASRRGVGILAKKVLGSGHEPDPRAALGSVLAVPGVTCAVIGTINPAHLRANCEATSVR